MQVDRIPIINRIRTASVTAWTDNRYNTSLNKIVQHICEETVEGLIDELNKQLALIEKPETKGPGRPRKEAENG